MKVKTITTTALLIALLITLQASTKALGQIVTGSCVNLVLAVAALAAGTVSGLIVAAVSPFCAYLLGIGPAFVQLVPLVALGNIVFVLALSLLPKLRLLRKFPPLSVAAAAAGKFLTLYIGIVKIAVPSLVKASVLPAAKQAAISASFSLPQLVTALIGGFLALGLSSTLRKALKTET